jgi:hypothetical protein
MTNAKVLALYKTTPLVLVVESAEGTVLEWSLTDLDRAGHRLSPDACTRLIEDYRICTYQPVAGSHAVDHRAREGSGARRAHHRQQIRVLSHLSM